MQKNKWNNTGRHLNTFYLSASAIGFPNLISLILPALEVKKDLNPI